MGSELSHSGKVGEAARPQGGPCKAVPGSWTMAQTGNWGKLQRSTGIVGDGGGVVGWIQFDSFHLHK